MRRMGGVGRGPPSTYVERQQRGQPRHPACCPFCCPLPQAQGETSLLATAGPCMTYVPCCRNARPCRLYGSQGCWVGSGPWRGSRGSRTSYAGKKTREDVKGIIIRGRISVDPSRGRRHAPPHKLIAALMIRVVCTFNATSMNDPEWRLLLQG